MLLSHLLGFSPREAGWPVLAFLMLATASGRVGARGLVRVCAALALVFAGVFAEAWHRPGPPPEIDAGSRETVLLEGCVVEPAVFSVGRSQFTLEIDRGARARVILALREEDTPQKLDYGQRVEIEARIRRP